jgi:CrcB protein
MNISGSLLLGLPLGRPLGTPAISREARALVTAARLGGYTNFSTFSKETAKLMENGEYRRARGTSI